MKLKAKSIGVGKCYATKHGEVRQVVSIQPSGEITFDTRRQAADGSWSQPRRFHSNLENFAREAVSETIPSIS
ncbi:MAG: hypothetical protein JWN93_2315 [Hyphomicrobiales bacterium]|nr:hypothetical protein [Hyphomicrobiales bacterium]